MGQTRKLPQLERAILKHLSGSFGDKNAARLARRGEEYEDSDDDDYSSSITPTTKRMKKRARKTSLWAQEKTPITKILKSIVKKHSNRERTKHRRTMPTSGHWSKVAAQLENYMQMVELGNAVKEPFERDEDE
jgi:hypothetical protein